MQARHRSRDCEPEPGPRPPRTGLVRAVKRLEQMRQFVLGQRRSGVLHSETQAPSLGGRGDHDVAAVRSELDGVIEQLLDEASSEPRIKRDIPDPGIELGA